MRHSDQLDLDHLKESGDDDQPIDFHANRNRKQIDLTLAQQQASIEYYKLSKLNYRNFLKQQNDSRLKRRILTGSGFHRQAVAQSFEEVVSKQNRQKSLRKK